MAALESTPFVQFAFPLSSPPFHNRNTLWSSEYGGSIPSLNASGSQRIQRPTAPFSRSGYQIEAESNTAASARDDDLPFLEEPSRATLRPKISTAASNAGSTLQRLEQPALHGAGLQVNRIQSGERQGGSRDQPVILDNDDPVKAGARDEAEGTSGDVDTGPIEQDASLHDTFATSELTSEPHSVPSASAQAQAQTVPQSSWPLQDQTNQQGVNDITRSTSVEVALHSLPKPSSSGDDGWTDENMAELEKELGLALEEQQVESLSAGTPTSPSPRSVEAPQDEIQSRERSETTDGRPDELRDTSPRGIPAQDLEGAVAMQQQEGLPAQREELGQPTVGDQQDLVEVVDADDPADRETTEAPPAAQPKIPEIDKRRFRLRGVRARQLAGRQTKTTQYRVVWGVHPNRSDSWFNEDDVRMSMPWPPCELYSQNLALQAEMDIFRVRGMRSSLHKGRKVFEYLVDALDLDDPWITEDQLRISISPMLVAELKGSSPHPLSEAQREVLLRHSATPMSDGYRHASRASRSSTPADPALGGKPATLKRRHQDVRTEISSDTHHSVNMDGNHNACDTDDEDPRPAKRRKPCSAPTVTPPLQLQRAPSLWSPSTTRAEIDEAQSQDGDRCSSTFVEEQRCASRTSRSSSAAAEAVPAAEYQQWPFQGCLKRITIGEDVTYNLEFKLPSISEHLHLPINPETLDICSSEAPAKVPTNHKAAAHSKIHQAPLQPQKRRARWTTEEDATLLQMRNRGCSWEEIHDALPHRSIGTIQVHYSTKLKGSVVESNGTVRTTSVLYPTPNTAKPWTPRLLHRKGVSRLAAMTTVV